jgi:hypothetical protein
MKNSPLSLRALHVLISALLLLILNPGERAHGAGRIVVAHDDWILQDDGFFDPTDPGRFAINVAGFFTRGAPGTFLAASEVPSFAGFNVANVMTAAGHNWTVSGSVPNTLAGLQAYDAVFLCWAPVPDHNLLISYVNAGGSVYLAGYGSMSEDMTKWNPFLHHFGLGFTNVSTASGALPIDSIHPILAGVDFLYSEEGVSIVDLNLIDPKNKVVARYDGTGLIAVWDENATRDLVASVRASQVEVCWESVSNATYRLEYRSSVTGNWVTLRPCVASQGNDTCIYDPVERGQPQRFYRVAATNCVPAL